MKESWLTAPPPFSDYREAPYGKLGSTSENGVLKRCEKGLDSINWFKLFMTFKSPPNSLNALNGLNYSDGYK